MKRFITISDIDLGEFKFATQFQEETLIMQIENHLSTQSS